MMSFSYVKNYFIVCFLVLFLVINTVAEIPLAHYSGYHKPLNAAGNIFINKCENEELDYNCYKKCGPNRGCLLGQCICLEASTVPEEGSDEKDEETEGCVVEVGKDTSSPHKAGSVFKKELQQEETREENNVGAEEVLREEESSFDESSSVVEELIERPALRHNIAHFCPNLDLARDCIRQCRKLHLPAFCGKDHICYCGHREGGSIEAGKEDDEYEDNPYRDLYERYFGKIRSRKRE